MRRKGATFHIAGYFGGLILAAAHAASAQRATQTVTFRVEAVEQIAIQGTPSLDITSAVAGQMPASVTASGSTWSVTTNQSGTKVTAALESDMPAGLTLSVQLGAPAGATSTGLKALGTTPVDVVTDVSKITATGLPVSYQLEAIPKAGVVTAGARVVVFTIVAGM